MWLLNLEYMIENKEIYVSTSYASRFTGAHYNDQNMCLRESSKSLTDLAYT